MNTVADSNCDRQSNQIARLAAEISEMASRVGAEFVVNEVKAQTYSAAKGGLMARRRVGTPRTA